MGKSVFRPQSVPDCKSRPKGNTPSLSVAKLTKGSSLKRQVSLFLTILVFVAIGSFCYSGSLKLSPSSNHVSPLLDKPLQFLADDFSKASKSLRGVNHSSSEEITQFFESGRAFYSSVLKNPNLSPLEKRKLWKS